jgi:hypothetical protein
MGKTYKDDGVVWDRKLQNKKQRAGKRPRQEDEAIFADSFEDDLLDKEDVKDTKTSM